MPLSFSRSSCRAGPACFFVVKRRESGVDLDHVIRLRSLAFTFCYVVVVTSQPFVLDRNRSIRDQLLLFSLFRVVMKDPMDAFLGLYDNNGTDSESEESWMAGPSASLPAGQQVPLGMGNNLPPEPQSGNIEYKLKLVNPTEQRIQHLVTQVLNCGDVSKNTWKHTFPFAQIYGNIQICLHHLFA